MKYKYILESVRHFCIKRGLKELGYIRKQKIQSQIKKGHKKITKLDKTKLKTAEVFVFITTIIFIIIIKKKLYTTICKIFQTCKSLHK